MTEYRKKLIEVAMPLGAINAEGSRRKRKAPKGYPTQLHAWWAQRPLAACVGVIFGQLVDDPSAWPAEFPTTQEQDEERERLFRVIEQLVQWDNAGNAAVLDSAGREIARSFARGRMADGVHDERDVEVLGKSPSPEVVRTYLATVVPPIHDPFAGGGSIPLEAQRLGVRTIATDLNPVAVLINKGMVEIPPKFAGRNPVGPTINASSQTQLPKGGWTGSSGLAEDVRRYGEWILHQAFGRLGGLYPPVEISEGMAEGRPDLVDFVGQSRPVIAWIWARTVSSPNPAFKSEQVPLASTFFLSTKKGREVWVEPMVDATQYEFVVRTGPPTDRAATSAGTKIGRGSNFRCLLSGSPIEPQYIKSEGQAGRLGTRLMAVVVQGGRSRLYLSPTDAIANVADCESSAWTPDAALPADPRNFWTVDYGLRTFGDLFTPRQLVALNTFADLIGEARSAAATDALAAGWDDDTMGLEEGGAGAIAYGDAIATYLTFVLSRLADYNSSLTTWRPKDNAMRSTLPRQVLSMAWDFAEGSPLGDSSSAWSKCLNTVCSTISLLPSSSVARAQVAQMDAARISPTDDSIVCTDPPYYDNIAYADLSDFYYVWIRRALAKTYPRLLTTIRTPKGDEMVASPYRQGGDDSARSFFEERLGEVLRRLTRRRSSETPVTIFYAFKQAETRGSGTSSTGWETFLHALVAAGFQITATTPLRTEGDNRQNSVGANALASSILLTCRPRPKAASTTTRGELKRRLRAELPGALGALQKGNIAPVDLAQASIGPGMAIFSRHSTVLEADGSPMKIRAALELIHEVTDEVRGEYEGELDRDTRFAVTWYETFGFQAGDYGDAETLAKARAVSVSGVQQSGVLHSAAGKVRLISRDDLPADWDPARDDRLTVWEATQHLIKRLDEDGEGAAADLMSKLGSIAEDARSLAYRLYTTCERKNWAEEARAYNSLVVAWPELVKLASQSAGSTSGPQGGLFE